MVRKAVSAILLLPLVAIPKETIEGQRQRAAIELERGVVLINIILLESLETKKGLQFQKDHSYANVEFAGHG